MIVGGGNMVLVDKDIKERINDKQLIIFGYNEDNVNGVSYDLTIECIYADGDDNVAEYDIAPGETVFVKSMEKLSIPNDILGRVGEKNSRMRQGLKVDAPHYQPGHVTYAYIRVQNISKNIITLKKGAKIAQIFFEKLTQVPDMPYSAQESASFQNETNFVGVGNYKELYEKETKKHVDEVKEDIENISHKIYANVLTIMGVLVAIFSLLSINYQAFAKAKVDFNYIIAMNLTLALSIVVMFGIILIFINKAKEKKFLIWYLVILIALAVATVIMGVAI